MRAKTQSDEEAILCNATAEAVMMHEHAVAGSEATKYIWRNALVGLSLQKWSRRVCSRAGQNRVERILTLTVWPHAGSRFPRVGFGCLRHVTSGIDGYMRG